MFIVETNWLDPSCSWLNHHVSPCLPVSQLVHGFRPRSTWRASGLRSSVARRQWGDASPFRVTRQKPWCRGFTHWDCRMGIYPLLGGWDSAINCPLWPQHEHMNNHPVWTIHLQKTMKTFTPVPIPGSWSTFQLPNLTCPLLLESRMMRYCNPCDTHVYRTKRCWDMVLRISAHEERLLRMVIIDIVTFCCLWDHRCHFSSLLWLGPSKQIDSGLLTAKM